MNNRDSISDRGRDFISSSSHKDRLWGPFIQWVLWTLSLGVKRPGREANHSPPSRAQVKKSWSYTSIPTYIFMAWCLIKHRCNFTFNVSGLCHHWSIGKYSGRLVPTGCYLYAFTSYTSCKKA